jgi:hypothetical protein
MYLQLRRYDLTPVFYRLTATSTYTHLYTISGYSSSNPALVNMFDRFTDTFKSSLSSVTRTLFRRKMPTKVDPVLPTEPQSVSVYIVMLETIHRLIGTKRLRSWKVTKVERLKSDRPSRHESARAWVRDPDGQMSIVIFERAGGEPMGSVSLPDLLRTSRNTSKSPSTSSSSSSLCPDLMAIDTVIPMEYMKSRKGDKVVGTLEFEDEYPSLYEVAKLADIVHKSASKYLLFSDNCYYFAATIILVLAAIYHSEMDMAASAGRWCGLDLTSGRRPDIPRLREQLKQETSESVSCFLC